MVISSPYEDFDLYTYFVELVKQIPEGKVASYLEIAKALGDPVAAVSCAYMQSELREAQNVPLHRVVRASGELGGYKTIEEVRGDTARLRDEGLTVRSGKVKFVDSHRFTDFETEYPLEKMKGEQEKLSERVSMDDDFDEDLIGAVDVSYDGRKGYAAFSYAEDDEYISRNRSMDANFPYIPGFLFYREYRFIKQLARNFGGTLLIDGNGLIHPRFFGLASATGVFLNKATIGVAKSLLLGRVKHNWVLYRDRKIGYVLNRNTIISPGHRISVDSSVDFMIGKYNHVYPEILKIAHNSTVKLRREQTKILEAS